MKKLLLILILSIMSFATSTDDFTLGYESFQKKDYVKAEEYYKKARNGYLYDFNSGQKTKMTNAHFNNLGLEY